MLPNGELCRVKCENTNVGKKNRKKIHVGNLSDTEEKNMYAMDAVTKQKIRYGKRRQRETKITQTKKHTQKI